MRIVLFFILIIFGSINICSSKCANGCSGHGECQLIDGGMKCVCDRGYNTSEGPDCSKRSCPQGTAWADFATAVDTAHALAECSNMGICDRTTGLCTCAPGFEGVACEKMSCVVKNGSPCSGNGKCMTLKEAAINRDDVTLFSSTTYSLWDADKIQGCICDEGYEGYDCSLRSCPTGLDTVGTAYVSEKQVIECTCQTTCTGYFYVKFKNQQAKVFNYDDATTVKRRLEELTTIPTVDVNMYGGTTVCDNDGVSTEITFRNNPGNLPSIEVHSSHTTTLTSNGGTPSLSIVHGGGAGANAPATSREGTAPIVQCSGRGKCNNAFGTCTCQNSGVASTGGLFEASDGEGNTGSRPDCGQNGVTPTGCVLADGGSGTPTVCASRGTCDGTTFKCNCNAGYTGHDCTLLTCPSGPSWFSEPTATDTAHGTAECSDMGICDRTTGTCTCRTGWTGTACELLACPGVAAGATACNGHGTCYTMKQLAQLSEDNGVLRGATYGVTPTAATWDHSSIQGCYCDSGYFHGPFAWDFSDYTGSYDCTLLTCPYGDNPQTTAQVNEVQTIICIATSGTFTLTFREEKTPDIPYNTNLVTFKQYLDALYSIHEVDVTFSGGSTTEVCSSSPGTTITLSFKVPGDLPLVTIDSSQLGGATVTISETTPGTTEFEECSGAGTCDRLTGICGCYQQYISSDGSGDGTTVGQRGDCGAMYIFQTIIDESSTE